MNPDVEKLGSPSIKLGHLQMWIHSRQFPEATDYWDGNWLRVTVHCGGEGSSVWANGPIIHLREIESWYTETQKLLDTLQGEARLQCMEPNLDVTLTAKGLGHIAIKISITPDHMTQQHEYLVELDQSYLPPLIQQCGKVLQEYPIRGAAPAAKT